jgi:ABC-2 type transport system permease protein
MVDSFRLYLRYIGISIRAQLAYRASFVMQVFGQLLLTVIEFLAVWALFDRFGSLAGWRLAEVGFFYGLIDVIFAIADALARGFDSFGSMVKGGDFDRLLLRPRSTVLQLLGQELTLKRVGRLSQGLVILVWASGAAGVDWSAAKAALLGAAVVGGVCLFIGIAVLQATSAFWTVETLEVWNVFTYGGNFAAQYPMPIFSSWFRRFFTFVVPVFCVGYLPAVAILGRPDPLQTPLLLQWLAPLAGVVFLLLALRVWRVGVRHYRSTGS